MLSRSSGSWEEVHVGSAETLRMGQRPEKKINTKSTWDLQAGFTENASLELSLDR